MTTQQPETTPSCEAFASQLQVFASAWAIVGGQFDAGDGMQTADAERAIVLDMWRRLHAENATLRAGYDAARLEIASLQAQLEAVGAGGVSALVGASQGQPVGAAPVAWLRNLTDPRPHAVTSLSYRSAADSDAGVEYVPVYTTPQPAAQALDSVRVFWQQHTQADALSMTMAELHDDVELVIRAAPSSAAPQPAAQAGEYPELPDLYSTGAPFWRAVLAWHDAHHGPEAINAADKLEMLVADMLRAYVDADRAARGAAQAVPVDATVQEDAERWQFLAEYLVGPRTDLDDEIVGCDSVQKMAGVIDAAIAAQKGGAA